jgi:hypothetical protein
MSGVVSRTLRASPHRDAGQTWDAIVGLLTQGRTGAARDELQAIAGIAISIVADQATEAAPIVATCDGPRTRIYTLHDDAAIEGDDANEEALPFDPLKGDWAVSLPCFAEDLAWVQTALAGKTKRVTARDQSVGIALESTSGEGSARSLTLDIGEFLKP